MTSDTITDWDAPAGKFQEPSGMAAGNISCYATIGANVTANTSATRKAKGRKLERFIADHYVAIGLYPTARPMPMSGQLKEMPGDIWVDGYNEWVEEAKNQETTSIWKWLEQAGFQAEELKKLPALHFKRNRSKVYTVIPFEVYADMRLELKKLRGK